MTDGLHYLELTELAVRIVPAFDKPADDSVSRKLMQRGRRATKYTAT